MWSLGAGRDHEPLCFVGAFGRLDPDSFRGGFLPEHGLLETLTLLSLGVVLVTYVLRSRFGSELAPESAVEAARE